MDDIQSKTIDAFKNELSIRVYNCILNELGFSESLPMISFVIGKSAKEWLRVPNFGKKSLKELRTFLGKYNLCLIDTKPTPPNHLECPHCGGDGFIRDRRRSHG